MKPTTHPMLNAVGMLGLGLAAVSSGLAQRGATPPILPNPRMTPGDVLPVTKADVCTPGYSKKVRDVPSDVKKQVYQNYGILSHGPRQFEVDHLISLELGGSNSIKNLWPESYETQPWNAHVKDQLENELHREICSGKIAMATAQHDIAVDWIGAYKKYFHTDVPLTKVGSHPKGSHAFPAPTSSKGSHSFNPLAGLFGSKRGKVWVNTASGKYFLPGARYYGKTKQGKYMTEKAALKQGYKAAQE